MKSDLTICGIVLAAGSSRRMGTINKLLMDMDGEAMVKRSVQPIAEAKLESVVVVTGFENEKIQSLLNGYELRFVFNEHFREGMGTSLAVGVESISAIEPDGILVSLSDLPYLRKESVLAVMERFCMLGGEKITIPVHNGIQGHPIVFPFRYAEELKALKGDQGARHLIRREEDSVAKLELNDFGIIRDVDSPNSL